VLTILAATINEPGPASHHPAPHYVPEEYDPDHTFCDLLNQAKDINPEAFAKHYYAAVLGRE
jgi:hypothetical protein